MTEKTLIVMWISVGVAVSVATFITGNSMCLIGLAAPTLITFFYMIIE